MNIEERFQDDIPILELRGTFTIGSRGDQQFRDAIQKHLRAGRTRIVADMSGVETLDSAAIGEIVGQHVSVDHRQGTLALAALSGRAADALETTRLVDVLRIYDSVDEAVEALS